LGLAIQAAWGAVLSRLAHPVDEYGRNLRIDAERKLQELEQADG
jgi:hypothetical protein